MAVTGVKGKVTVEKLGGAVEERYDYVDGSTYTEGDLIRLSSGGEIKVSGITSGAPPHGISLYAVDTEVNEPAPVILFDDDTRISIPCIDGVAPEDLTKGLTYTLEKGSDGIWGVTSTTTDGCVTVVGYANDGTPWSDRYGSFDEDETVDNNRVIVRVKREFLDTVAV